MIQLGRSLHETLRSYIVKSVELKYWTLDVSRTLSYEITLVRLFACPSVTKFSQDWIISFF